MPALALVQAKPCTPRHRGTARPIDLVYGDVNVLGGYVDRSDPVAVALDAQLAAILEILEAHGARDPDLIAPD